MSMPDYIIPYGYLDLTPEQKEAICNGCGGKGVPDLVPDCILGADVTEPCNMHDYEFHLGKDFFGANRRFLHNLLAACQTDDIILFEARAKICFKYYEGVTCFGKHFFGKG